MVKFGTRLLTKGDSTINLTIIGDLIRQIAALHADGIEVVIVSSGAVTMGREQLKELHHTKNLAKSTIDYRKVAGKQVLAALGQPALMQLFYQAFALHQLKVGQLLLSRDDLQSRRGYLNIRDTLFGLLNARIVPIVNENDPVAVHELVNDMYGDNDRLSAMVANVLDADMLILLGETDGLYTDDPNLNPKARLIPTVRKITKAVRAAAGKPYDGLGSGGMQSKLEAAELAMSSGVPLIIASGKVPDVLTNLCKRGVHGTYFVPTLSRMEARKRWMITGVMEEKGVLVVDEGARRAITQNHTSLLPVGISGLNGDFERGDILRVLSQSGETLAFGITNYDLSDVRSIMGANSRTIKDLIGKDYGADVIHRNNMVLVNHPDRVTT